MKSTLSELYLAFRQAKHELFRERNTVRLLQLAQYEKDLLSNLRQLRAHLASKDTWFDGLSIGQLWVVPKSLEPRDEGVSERHNSSAGDKVVDIGTEDSQDLSSSRLNVRIQLTPSVNFAIVEILYLWRFGIHLDGLLGPESMGYRLRLDPGAEFAVDQFRQSPFEFWPERYAAFRNEPLDVARRALRNGTEADSIVIATLDLAAFYDTVDPSFLLSAPMLKSLAAASAKVGGQFARADYLTATQSLLRAFARYRRAAERLTRLRVNQGIPIGALTSRIIGNVALETLDRRMRGLRGLLCYRRYVDDILLVVDGNVQNAKSTREFLSGWLPLKKRDDGTLDLDGESLERPGSVFKVQLRKVRTYRLRGRDGEEFLRTVQADVRRIGSERRAFMDESVFSGSLLERIVRRRDGKLSPIRALRDADRLRLERFELNIAIRSLELAARLLDRPDAKQLVLRAVRQVLHLLNTRDEWIDNLDMALRVLSLCVATEASDACLELVRETDRLWRRVVSRGRRAPPLYWNGMKVDGDAARPRLRAFLRERRLEAICSALPLNRILGAKANWPKQVLRAKRPIAAQAALKRRARLLAFADLRMLDREQHVENGQPALLRESPRLEAVLKRGRRLAERLKLIGSFVRRCRRLGDRAWSGGAASIYLSPRPPSYFDVARRWLYHADQGGLDEATFTRLLEIVNALRGTRYKEPLGRVLSRDARGATIGIGDVNGLYVESESTRIILGNLVVMPEWFDGAASPQSTNPYGAPKLPLRRLRGLARLLDRARLVAAEGTADGRRFRYPALLVLPELSLPRAWLREISRYVVKHCGFALIAGLEYIHHPALPYVFNQVVGVFPLPLSSAGVWMWTKRHPSRGEEALLRDKHGVSFAPALRQPQRSVLHTAHGRLSVLICSELIEASMIATLVGRTELVLTPAWNEDTASFDHLVQSAGLYLHSIVAIANNGRYSDCRVWGPRYVRWRRDFARLIQRETDDVVYVDVRSGELRRFHAKGGSSHAPLKEPSDPAWKPLPPDWPA